MSFQTGSGYGDRDTAPGSYRIESDDQAASQADQTKQAAADVASAARGHAAGVADQATSSAKDVVGAARDQAQQVAGTTRAQLSGLVDQTRSELSDQASTQTARAAGGLRSLAGQVGAMAEGRTADAGPLPDYARQGADRMGRYADRLKSGGFEVALSDLQAFARRRPAVFLLGAAGAGFLAGRLARGVQAAHSDDSPGGTAISQTSGSMNRPTTGAFTETAIPNTISRQPVSSGMSTAGTTTGFGTQGVAGHASAIGSDDPIVLTDDAVGSGTEHDLASPRTGPGL